MWAALLDAAAPLAAQPEVLNCRRKRPGAKGAALLHI